MTGRLFLKTSCFFTLLFCFPLVFLIPQQQEEPDFLDKGYRKVLLKSMALEEIAQGNYRDALEHLDAAASLFPEEEEIRNLRDSVMDILILKENQPSASSLTVKPEFSSFREESEKEDENFMTPDFAAELLKEAGQLNPEKNRDAFTLSLGSAYGFTQPINWEESTLISQGSQADHPFGRISGDVQYFFKESLRNFGFGLRYKGSLYNRDQVDMVEHQINMSFLARGFFSETLENRMIVGVKGGLSIFLMGEHKTGTQGVFVPFTLFFMGFYIDDALLRYLFKKQDFFKKLIIGFNSDFYFIPASQGFNMVFFNFAVGYRFTPHWDLSLYNEILNTSSNLDSVNAVETGLRLRYRY